MPFRLRILHFRQRFAPRHFVESGAAALPAAGGSGDVHLAAGLGARLRQVSGRLDWSWLALLAMVATYLLPGLIGHDPWKQDETYIFGIIHHLIESGDWIVPTMAGEPFMEKPPLYYWVAALFAQGLSPWLALHDGARLATGFFMMLTCIASGWTARQWWGRGYGRFAVLALLGCLGLVLHGHMMLTDVPLLTGFAIATSGFVYARQRCWQSGFLLGLGVGIGFMAKGVLALGVFGLSAVLLPVLFRPWRQRSYLYTLLLAALFALPWLLIWPLALYLRSYALFMDWFWLNNIGRFFGFSVAMLGAPHTDGFWISTLPWFTFPALPLALLSLWQQGRSALRQAAVQVSLLVFSIMLLVLWSAASARDNYALPLLLPISLLAAPAARNLSLRGDRWLDWSARLLFGAAIIFIWVVWIIMMAKGAPPDWTFLLKHLPQEFQPNLEKGVLAFALLLTAAALLAMQRVAIMPGRGLISWVSGLTLCWLLVSSLWLPWIDRAKSYRGVFASMQTALPSGYGCMASVGLGESERAMLSYFAGITTLRMEIQPDAHCDLLLVDGFVHQLPLQIDRQQWQLVWEGARPGDLNERLWLFATRTAQLAAAGNRQALR